MKFLLIDDSPTKIDLVEDFLKNSKYSELIIVKKVSWRSGLIEIIENFKCYDFLILDMSMPRYDPGLADINEEFEIYAGWEILKEMKRLDVSIPTCLFTSYGYFGKGHEIINLETIHQKLISQFPDMYKGIVYFSTTDSSWKDKMKNILDGVVGNENFNSRR